MSRARQGWKSVEHGGGGEIGGAATWRGFWQRGQAVVGAQCGGGELKVACAGEPVAEARHSGGDLEMADVG